MHTLRIWLAPGVLALALALVGCSREESTQDAAGMAPEDTVFGDQVKALEKAQDVQDTLDAADARQREAIERQE